MKSIKNRIDEQVKQYLKDYGIKPGARIIAAWSGGTDSTAMLSILKNLDGFNFDITAAWYNHCLRDEADMLSEEQLVNRLAAEFEVHLVKGYAGKGVLKKMAQQESLSLEEAARNARYSFLEETLKTRNADFISLGHNLNDNTETMLMRIMQNAGLRGLSGIPEKRGVIIRPMCRLSRGEIEEYLDSVRLSFSTDRTNLENEFLRNRLRNKVIPAAREIFPVLDRSMYELSGKIKEQNDFIDNETVKRLKWTEDLGVWKIEQSIFYAQPLILRINSIFMILNRIGIGSRIRYKAIEQAVDGNFPGNGKTLLRTSSFEIAARSGYIFIQRLVNQAEKSYFIYLEPGMHRMFAGQSLTVYESDGYKNSEPPALNRMTVSSNGDLIIRSYREGDYIYTENGKKSVKKIFNEWKVVSADRSRLPLVESCGIIIAVAGKHLGYENRFSVDSNKNQCRKKILLIFNSDTETICE
ncbi:MAG: tRNA lysidine(34) synthetase TilS [Spirochaetales bacterium]|uniref:tRNA(Ile)-lysidine synthase n=1 Tax=Candidatus Thalassospirochaeta sargassi TaxID=3119039 RepID=A0AAJ1ID10_9SPIO|nr:tRNA lysidine(34) synthetase TilS [Spirochaetales bacterium]